MSKRKKKNPTPNAKPAAPVKPKVVAPVKQEITKFVESKVAPVRIVEPFDCPAISVVIPMYNAEKFIAECLNSLLAQTFKKFEVIVVDDCSTDNSPAIVDSFIPKFGGRLNHCRLKKNSGGASFPRNTGITLARGKYIRFADADDRLIDTALEEDLILAEKFNADVVYHTLFYNLSADGTKGELAAVPKYKNGDEIVLDEDLPNRILDLARNKYYHAPWRSFSRRDFLVANELYFPNISPHEDVVWNCALLIYSRRFLRVPSAIYFYRHHENSLLIKEQIAAKNAKFYLKPIIVGLKSLDAFISRNRFFDTNPELHYALLETYFNRRFRSLFKNNSGLASSVLYETLKKDFGKDFDDYDVLIPALCTALAQQQKITAMKLNEFKAYAAQAEQKIIALQNEINRRKNKQ